jgi:hypothetical protein
MTGWPPAPSDLASFPSVIISGEEQTFYRIHRSNNDPAFFSTSPSYRFSPPHGSEHEYGPCYLGESPECAFLETLGRFPVLTDAVVQERVISELYLPAGTRLADLTDPRVLGEFHVDNDLSTGRDYDRPRAWGAALRAAEFGGIRYRARHDPSAIQTSIALFGPPGSSPGFFKAVSEPVPIGEELLLFMTRVYGIHAAPPDPLD